MSPATTVHHLRGAIPGDPHARLACTGVAVNIMESDPVQGTSIHVVRQTGEHFAFSASQANCPACRAKKEGAK